MAKTMKHVAIIHRLLTLLRCAIALLFLYAGAVKLWNTQDFAYDVQSYQLTSWTVSILIAVYLPWLEVFAALALLAKRLYLGALIISITLLTVFLAALGSAWWRGVDITCGCFAPEENKTNYPLHVGADLALVAAVVLLLMHEIRRERAPQ